MTTDPIAIEVRLSKNQMSMIWPGLDFIFRAYLTREAVGTCEFAYPFQLLQLPQDFDSGTFSPWMMDHIRALYIKVQPRAKTGGRIQMDCFEIRAAILSVRIYLGLWRRRAYDNRRLDAATKGRWRLDRKSIKSRQDGAQRLIGSLERLMKRATRRFLSEVSREEFAAKSKEWQDHLRWIRFRLAYFKPYRPWTVGPRVWQRKVIDGLVKVAEEGIQSQGYSLPNAARLRSLMRQVARYSRRGRGKILHFPKIVEKKEDPRTQEFITEFVKKRLRLRRKRVS